MPSRVTDPRGFLRGLATTSGPPRPGDVGLARTVNHVIAAPQQSLDAVAEVARRAGVTPVILGDAIEGRPARWESALEEQQNGEWRYLEFLQVTSFDHGRHIHA